MNNLIENLASSLGTIGEVLLKGAWEGTKIGFETGKILGKDIVKETVKGTLNGVGAVGKAILEK